MKNLTISVFGNQIFSEILNELKLFSDVKIKYYDDLSLCKKEAKNKDYLLIYFQPLKKLNIDEILNSNSYPIIVVKKLKNHTKVFSGDLVDYLFLPFNVLLLKSKITALLAKHEFKKRSLIDLKGYIIDKNERKIKKENLVLQLTEKEINFLVLFSERQNPISRDEILKNVWNYSSESDTHTVETHIHRLRKKILEKFSDNNFIKNNEKGYYI